MARISVRFGSISTRDKVTYYAIKVHWDEETWNIHRRYSDFEKLHSSLSSSCRNLPSLPSKRYRMGWLFRTHEEHTENRRGELEMYLNAILKHNKACRSPDLERFLGLTLHMLHPERLCPEAMKDGFYATSSMCPKCVLVELRRPVWQPAVVLDRRGKAVLHSHCPRHGLFESVVCSNMAFYQRMIAFNRIAQIGPPSQQDSSKGHVGQPLVVELPIFESGRFLTEDEIEDRIDTIEAHFPEDRRFFLRVNVQLATDIATTNKLLHFVNGRMEGARFFVEGSYERVILLMWEEDSVFLKSNVCPAAKMFVRHGDEAASEMELRRMVKSLRSLSDMEVLVTLCVEHPLPDIRGLLSFLRTSSDVVKFVVFNLERSPTSLVRTLRTNRTHPPVKPSFRSNSIPRTSSFSESFSDRENNKPNASIGAVSGNGECNKSNTGTGALSGDRDSSKSNADTGIGSGDEESNKPNAGTDVINISGTPGAGRASPPSIDDELGPADLKQGKQYKQGLGDADTVAAYSGEGEGPLAPVKPGEPARAAAEGSAGEGSAAAAAAAAAAAGSMASESEPGCNTTESDGPPAGLTSSLSECDACRERPAAAAETNAYNHFQDIFAFDGFQLIEKIRDATGDIYPTDFIPASAGTVLESIIGTIRGDSFYLRPSPTCSYVTCLLASADKTFRPWTHFYDIFRLLRAVDVRSAAAGEGGDQPSGSGGGLSLKAVRMLALLKAACSKAARLDAKNIGDAFPHEQTFQSKKNLEDMEFQVIMVHSGMDVGALNSRCCCMFASLRPDGRLSCTCSQSF
eukprot:Rmarinus@m.8947